MNGGDTVAGTTIRAVVFDYGGVLTTPGRSAIAEWTEHERIDPGTFSTTLKAWLSRSAPAGTPIHRLETGELGLAEFNRELAAQLRTVDGGPVPPEGLIERMFARMRPVPAMHELVRALPRCGVRTALLSNSWGNRYPEELRELFEVAVISGEVGLRKPEPEIYHRTLERLALRPERTVFVDDAEPNTATARQLGMHTITHADADVTRRELAEFVPEIADATSPVPREHPQETEIR
ncbi:HAD family hydrolase [Salinifilum ghardaiensis]